MVLVYLKAPTVDVAPHAPSINCSVESVCRAIPISLVPAFSDLLYRCTCTPTRLRWSRQRGACTGMSPGDVFCSCLGFALVLEAGGRGGESISIVST